jgi:hypothetical protein
MKRDIKGFFIQRNYLKKCVAKPTVIIMDASENLQFGRCLSDSAKRKHTWSVIQVSLFDAMGL